MSSEGFSTLKKCRDMSSEDYAAHPVEQNTMVAFALLFSLNFELAGSGVAAGYNGCLVHVKAHQTIITICTELHTKSDHSEKMKALRPDFQTNT